MISKDTLLNYLDNMDIAYQIKEHEAFHTVKDSEKKRDKLNGAHTKNLFLKNKKKQFFLFSCLENTNINLKKLSKKLSLGNLSFANSDYLFELLGVLPGSVTPFGLLNDFKNEVSFYLDYNTLSYKNINFHPLVNTSTLNLSLQDFMNFLVENKKKINIFDFNIYALKE